MPDITSNFDCGYEIVSMGQSLEIIEKQDKELMARRVTTLVRRKFAADLTELTHLAGNIVDANTLCASNGAGTDLCMFPNTSKYYCASDSWEHDEYGPTGYGFETWTSYSKYFPYELPTEAHGTPVSATAVCGAGVYGIVSSISDTDIRRTGEFEAEIIEQRSRHTFTISVELGDVTFYQPNAGIVLQGNSIEASFGNATNSILTANPSKFYVLERDVMVKTLNTAKMTRHLTFTSYDDYEQIDLDELNMDEPE